jgi:2-(1,2-epoxy-1,2-dihydrophenyl)acetyl-CoA isomerase
VEIEYEQPRDGVVVIRLNRPEKMNALSGSLEHAFLTALEQACDDESVRVVILVGAGDNFCAGWDLQETDQADPAHHPLSARVGHQPWLRLVRLLRRPDKLFIAAVHGWVAGQGVELCVSCDLTVCTESARFYFAETRVGFAMSSGTARLLPLMVGLANARKLALLGQTIDGAEAYRIGLAVEVTADGEHEAVALRLADNALQGAPIAVAAQKQLIDAAMEMSLEGIRGYEILTSFRLAQTEDHQEAKRAFAAKRVPVFQGR